jgi:hypothetical protein
MLLPAPLAGAADDGLGVALVFVGPIDLLRSPDFAWARWLRFERLWPLLVMGGPALILRRMRGG